MIPNSLELYLYTHKELAVLFSILINIGISIAAFIPSVFLTALNVKLFGLLGGIVVSIIGESLGALVSFWLYRTGLQTFTQQKTDSYPKVQKLLNVRGKEAFLLILSFRLLPFVPSGLVTLFAALGKVSWIIFAVASTLGKIPALLLEAYSVNELLHWTKTGKVLSGALAVGILVYGWNKYKSKNT